MCLYFAAVHHVMSQCLHAGSVPFATCGSLGVAYAGVEAIAGPPRGANAAIVATARCAGGLTPCQAPYMQHYRLRPPRWLGQRGGGSNGKGSACQGPGFAWAARHPAFWLVPPLHARIFCGLPARVPCSSRPLPMRSSTQLRRHYGIAQTMKAQQGAVQGPPV
ncbi:hypothetical protein K438DRAFT_1784154 [Mycena galopus ATCC 62051]|nr:hypothetical protein K438DRAFT_1784154 [Mycena galopus ATCC 62051]